MDIQSLKERKKALKITTNDLADMIAVPYGTLSKIFTGETQNPLYITVEKIDKALSKLEQEQRILAYQAALSEYMKAHLDEMDFDIHAFEKQYRKEHHLSPEPIPFAVPMDAATEGNLAVQNPSKMTVEEFAQMETTRNVELIDGELITADMPTYEHQALLEGLGDAIKEYIKKNNGKCKVHTAGLNLRLDESDQSVLVPDIIVRCTNGTVMDYGILGAPDWIIEITSPSTRRRDYRIKYSKYLDAGVREYWVVDLQKRIVATYINDMPAITGLYQFTDQIPVSVFDNRLTIKIDDLLGEETSGPNK